MARWIYGVIGGTLLVPSVFAASYLDMGWDYKRGDFGSGQTVSLQAPWLGMSHYDPRGWAVSLLVPYYRVDDGQERISGLGDVFTSVSRMGFFGRWTPTVGALLKWPVADAQAGLGTGDFDWALQLGVGYALRPTLRLLGQWAYTFTGDGSGQGYQDYASLAVGLYRQRGPLGWSLSWSDRGASVAGGSPARELSGGVGYMIDGRWRIQARLARGFSDGAADLSLGTALSWRW